MVAPPQTITQTTHAMTLSRNGILIGAVNAWNPAITRTITEVYEFGDGTLGGYSPGAGVPYEKVPGNVSGMQISVQRYDIYTAQMESAFGTPNLDMLAEQSAALELREAHRVPAGGVGATGQAYATVYSGCWFANIGRTLSATGERTINVSATIEYVRKLRVPV